MKKLWIVLLSVALIMAFAMPVCAADVKMSGNYIIQGYYENNRALVKDGQASVGNIWQRLRLQTDIQVQEGLKLTARADIMEKIWGAARAPITSSGSTISVPAFGYDSNGNNWEAENIKFEHVYVSANLFGGLLRVGYQQQSVFGTAFADSGDSTYGPRVRYDYQIGPWTLIALWDKIEGTQYYSAKGPAGNIGDPAYQVDATAEKYVGAFMYNWGKGNAGLLFYYYLLSQTSGPSSAAVTDTGYKGQFWVFDPYFKAQIGPLYLEGELTYWVGKSRKAEGNNPANRDIDRDGWGAYLTGTYDFAPMYAGALFAYVSGDDKGTTDKDEQGPPGGTDFNPCLMLFNYDLARWNGAYGTNGAAYGYSANTQMSNVMLLQFFVGMKPVPKLDIRASYSWAQADKDGAAVGWQDKNYGSELDITATYKIYDNLSYMVGFGYLWAGDYFKGTNPTGQVDNDYLITHKLTLTF